MSDEHPPPFHGFGLSLVSSGIAHFNYTVQNYAYDHRGRMVRKDISRRDAEARRIEYLWDNWNIIRETHVSRLASRVTHNVWGLDLDGTLQGAGGVGGLLAVIGPRPMGEGQGEGGTAYLPCYDANGNISEYVSTNGEVVAHYDYSPFGETLVASGPLAATFTHRFSTKPWCTVTGFYEYQFRKYVPHIGRWMSRDPVLEHHFTVNMDSVSSHEKVVPSSYGQYKITHDVIDGHSPIIVPSPSYLSNKPQNTVDFLGLVAWSMDCSCPCEGSCTITKNPLFGSTITYKGTCTERIKLIYMGIGEPACSCCSIDSYADEPPKIINGKKCYKSYKICVAVHDRHFRKLCDKWRTPDDCDWYCP